MGTPEIFCAAGTLSAGFFAGFAVVDTPGIFCRAFSPWGCFVGGILKTVGTPKRTLQDSL